MSHRYLSDSDLSEGAFALWTSSNTSRYLRMARRIAATSSLAQPLWSSPSSVIPGVLARCESLMATVARARVRTPDEVELALLLASIERSASPVAERILRAAALDDSPGMIWVAALARDALRRREASISVRSGFARGSQPVGSDIVATVPTPTTEWRKVS